jgi:hypothetical protein
MQHLYEIQMIGATGQIERPFLMQGLPFEGLLLKSGQSCYQVTKVMAHLPEGEEWVVRKVDVKVEYTGQGYM